MTVADLGGTYPSCRSGEAVDIMEKRLKVCGQLGGLWRGILASPADCANTADD